MATATYFKRTPSSDGNRSVFTWAAWIRRENVGAWQRVFTVQDAPGDASGSNGNAAIQFTGDSYFRWFDTMQHSDSQNTDDVNLITTARFRDHHGWVHFMAVLDSIRANNEQRASLYVNGTRISHYTSQDWGQQNQKSSINMRGNMHLIGYRQPSGSFSENCPMGIFDNYFVDGLALTPDEFGYYRTDRGSLSTGCKAADYSEFKGEWYPLAPNIVKSKVEQKGGFGVNGFYLPFNGANDPGADFHMTPDTILELKTDQQQPLAEIKGVQTVREDPLKDYLKLAIPGVRGGLGQGYGDYTHLIRGTGSPWSVTPAGNAKEPSNTYWYYGSALTFNGSNHSYDLDAGFPAFGSGDWTIEWWMNPSTLAGTYLGLVDFTSSSGAKRIETALQSSSLHIYTDTQSWRDTGFAPPVGQWSHCCLEKHNGILSFYADGNLRWSVTNTRNYDETSTPKIGRHSNYYDGYMSDIRVYQGIAKYRGIFDTPKPYGSHNLPKLIYYNNFHDNITGWGNDSGAVVSHDSGNHSGQALGALDIDNGPDNTFAAVTYNKLISGKRYRVRGRARCTVSGSYEFRIRAGGSGTQWNMTSGITSGQWFTFDTGAITADGTKLEIGSNAGGITYITVDWIGIWEYDNTSYHDDYNTGKTSNKTWQVIPDAFPTNQFARISRLDGGRTGQGNAHDRIQNGGLTFHDDGSDGWETARATMGVKSGKWYWEIHHTNSAGNNDNIVMLTSIMGQSGIDAHRGARHSYLPGQSHDAGVTYYNNGGTGALYHADNQSGGTTWGESYGDGDITSVALDMDNKMVWFAKNGKWQSSGDPASMAYPARDKLGKYSEWWFPAFGSYYEGSWQTVNFGQNPTFCGFLHEHEKGTYKDDNDVGLFKYEPPAGFLALCTKNLPDPVISNPRDYFSATTYQGNGNRQSVTVGHETDMVWVKCRSHSGSDWYIADSLRNSYQLLINSDAVHNQNAANGIYFGGPGSKKVSIGQIGDTNSSGYHYSLYAWKAGGSKSTYNIDGEGYSTTDIFEARTGIDLTTGSHTPTSISISTKAGLSIVRYTSTTSVGTVAHGLEMLDGQQSGDPRDPAMIVTKQLSATRNWHWGNTQVKGDGDFNTSDTESHGYKAFNNTNSYDGGNGRRAHLHPDGKHFNVDSTTNGIEFVAYIWKEIEGFSKFGTYCGNGQNDGEFTYCGFRPAFVLFVKAGSGENTRIIDSARDSWNQAQKHNFVSSGNAESSETGFDFCANGFKCRSNDGHINGDNEAYMYMAFAESPFKYATGR